MTTTPPPWRSPPEELPGFAEWAEEQDRRHSWEVLMKAANLLLAGVPLRCTCAGGECFHCVLDRTVAELGGGAEATP